MAFVCSEGHDQNLLARHADHEARLYKNATYRESESLYYVHTDADNRYDAWMYEVLEFKKILAVQLPKMPSPYTVRLLTDKQHAVLTLKQRTALPNKDGKTFIYHTIGGVMFRSFPDIFAAELVFLAIHPDDQMKGYGQRLMATFKELLKKQGLKYIVTYADNTAMDFFAKIGFTTKLTVPPNLWAKHIKDYDEATLMECLLLDIDYRAFHSELGLLQAFTHQVVVAGAGQQMRECAGIPAACYLQPSNSQSDILTKLQAAGVTKLCKGIDLARQLELLAQRHRSPTKAETNAALVRKIITDEFVWQIESPDHKGKPAIDYLVGLRQMLKASASQPDEVLEDKLIELTTQVKQLAEFGSQSYKRADRIEELIEDYHNEQEQELQHPLMKKVA